MFVFSHIISVDETDAKKILTASLLENWRIPSGRPPTTWRLFSRTWNPVTSPWMKQLMWLKIVNSGDWCPRLVLSTRSGACHKRRYVHAMLWYWNTGAKFRAIRITDHLILRYFLVASSDMWKYYLWHYQSCSDWDIIPFSAKKQILLGIHIIQHYLGLVYWWYFNNNKLK